MATESFPESPLWSPSESDYSWPRGSMSDETVYVKHGRVESLPAPRSKVARIFLSSTFTDTYAERNLLIKSVYPKLKKVCKEKFDLDFQVVDMRWGVRNEATVDHSASTLCMTEIDNCMKHSVGPTFVALLSHRCGGRTLPTSISQHEMEKITAAIQSWEDHRDSIDLVQKWYKLDENAIPPEYNLQPIVKYKDMEKFLKEPIKGYYYESHDYLRDETEEFTMIDSLEKLIEGFADEGEAVEEAKKVYKTLSSQEKKVWAADEPELSRIIRQAISQCIQNGSLVREMCHKYFQSITEEEVRRGLLEDPDRNDHCLVFRRRINDINLNHKKAWRFIDMTDDNRVDTEAQQLLDHLRDVEVPECLNKDNFFDFQVTWSDQEGINEEDHAEYLKDFCEKFESSVLNLIERGVKKTSQTGMDEVYSEALEHGYQCAQRLKGFHGREAEVNTIRQYITSTSDQPLIVHGESGCGKTSVLAKAASLIPKWLGDTQNTCVILRFLGTTLDSSTVYKMLKSITWQIITITDLRKHYPKLPEEFTDLRNMFKDLLTSVPAKKRLVIVLDSLDQVSGIGDSNGLSWLPRKLPPYVKLVVSTIPEEHDILTRLRSEELNLTATQFLPVEMMTSEVGQQIIQMWLKMENRRLTTDQTQQVNQLIKGEVRALYLKLIFNEISTWKSYQNPKFYCPNISSCLHRMFRKLEVKHGEIIVKHALGYLCASRHGLTHLEMEDILSLDDVVLTDVFEFHVPPIRRLPSILWSRIRNDLQEYIVERGADGVRIMAWYHRQLLVDARRRYLPGKQGYETGGEYYEKNIHLFKGLADYFAGIWGGEKEKPFIYTEFQRKKLGLASNDAALTRYVPDQPSIYRDQDDSLNIENLRFNRRKTSELPHVCSAVFNNEDYTAFVAEHIVFNQEFLTAWIGTAEWETVLEFFNLVSRGNDFVPETDNLSQRLCQLEKPTPDHSNETVVASCDMEMLSRGTEGLALQMSAMMQSLVMSFSSAIHNPSCIGADITGRLLRHNNSLEGIANWIDYTYNNGRNLCALVPPHTHLDTPGNELFFVITNHRGPVTDAEWAPGDGLMCASVSQRFVLSSTESGTIVQDTKPQSVPKGDVFCKVTVLLTKYKKTLYIASLKEHPWLYVFNEDGEVLNVVKLSAKLKDPVQVSELKAFLHTTTLENCVIVLDKTKNTLFVINEVLLETAVCSKVGSEDSGRTRAVYLSVQNQSSEDASDQSMQRILLLKERGVWELYDETWRLEDQCDFQWPAVCSTSADTNTSSKPITIAIGFENGEVCLVMWESQCSDLGGLHPVYLLNQGISSGDVSHHDPVLYVCYHTAEDNEDNDEQSSKATDTEQKGQTGGTRASKKTALCLAQTKSCLFLSRLKEDVSERIESVEEVPTELPGLDSKANAGSKNNQKLEIVWKTGKKYDFAVFSRKLHFIFAVHGGMVDVLKLKNLENTEYEQLKVTIFMTIAAHSDDINKILVLEDDVFFMTISKDSTMKFFLLGRSRISRKYRTRFDHTDERITEISADKDKAITWTNPARSVYQWDIITGKITTIFHHPDQGSFIACATNAEMTLLASIDTEGNCYIWKLKRPSSPNTVHPLNNQLLQRAVDKPMPDLVLEACIPVDQLTESGQTYMSVFPQNVVLFAIEGTNVAHVITHDSGHTETKTFHTMRNPIANVLPLREGMVLFVSQKECSVFIVESKSIQMVFSLRGLTGHELSWVNDVQVTPYLGQILFYLDNTLVFWTPNSREGSTNMSLDQTDTEQQQESHKAEPTSTKKKKKKKRHAGHSRCLLTSESRICVVLDTYTKQYTVVDVESRQVLATRQISKASQDLEFYTLTPDGAYMVYVCGGRHLYLLRLSDGHLLAWYTLYTAVTSLSTSSDSCYVLVGTADCRLFVLIIADPDVESHEERIQRARAANPPFEQHVVAQLLANIDDYNNYSPDVSDSEEEKADTNEVQRTGVVIQRDSFGLEDNEESDCPQTECGIGGLNGELSHKECQGFTNASVREEKLGSDTQFFTTTPCSLQ